MSWFATKEDLRDHFDNFYRHRVRELGLQVNVEAGEVKEGCRLILSNRPHYPTCEKVCGAYSSCDEKDSDYCKITTNDKNKFDPARMRIQARLFSRGLLKNKELIEQVLGPKRLNYFLAPIIEQGIKNFRSLGRKDRKEAEGKYGLNYSLTPLDFLPITIEDVENDPWTIYVRSKIKQPESGLLWEGEETI